MSKDFQFDIYMTCPVTNATQEEIKFLRQYKKEQEARGLSVLYPADDTEQNDPTGGYRICDDHVHEINNSKEVHTYWNPDSIGSYVDLGTTLINHFIHGRSARLINREAVERMVSKRRGWQSHPNHEQVLLTLDNLAQDEEEREEIDRTYWMYKGICERRNNEKESYIHWTPDSKRNHVDLGIIFPNHFLHGRNIRLINRATVENIVVEKQSQGIQKSYEHVLLTLDDLTKK